MLSTFFSVSAPGTSDSTIEADISVSKNVGYAASPKDDLGKLDIPDSRLRSFAIVMMLHGGLPDSICENERKQSCFQYIDEAIKLNAAAYTLLTPPQTVTDSPTGSFAVPVGVVSQSPEG
jgi:hypothetical protein